MRLAIALSKEHPSLPQAEVNALFGPAVGSPVALLESSLGAKTLQSRLSRLAFSRLAIELLFDCPLADLEANLRDHPWAIKGPYGVFAQDTQESKRKPLLHYADIIWRAQERPQVDLKTPQTSIHIIFTKDHAYVGYRLWQAEDDFNSRKAHKRPGFLPTSMHPKLAKAAVNLLGADCMSVLDPFCGSGGLLIEAGKMGLKIEGWDLSAQAIERCKENLAHYGLNGEVKVKDALTLGKAGYIVTDLPYGRNTSISKPLVKLYEEFYARLARSGFKRAVVMQQSIAPLPKGLKIAASFDIYIHKSMTKRVLILTP